MPSVHRNESKDKYISRAIKYMIDNEGLEQKHAIAKAYGMWKEHLKKITNLALNKKR